MHPNIDVLSGDGNSLGRIVAALADLSAVDSYETLQAELIDLSPAWRTA
jgi:hypothetical protein